MGVTPSLDMAEEYNKKLQMLEKISEANDKLNV